MNGIECYAGPILTGPLTTLSAAALVLLLAWCVLRMRRPQALLVGISNVLLLNTALVVALLSGPGPDQVFFLNQVMWLAVASYLLLPAAAWIAQSIDRRGRKRNSPPVDPARAGTVPPRRAAAGRGRRFVPLSTGLASLVDLTLSRVALAQSRQTGQGGRGRAHGRHHWL